MDRPDLLAPPVAAALKDWDGPVPVSSIRVAEIDPEVADTAAFCERYGVPPERQYTDYRELLAKERPEIVSVATQPEQRAEIVIPAEPQAAACSDRSARCSARAAGAPSATRPASRTPLRRKISPPRGW